MVIVKRAAKIAALFYQARIADVFVIIFFAFSLH